VRYGLKELAMADKKFKPGEQLKIVDEKHPDCGLLVTVAPPDPMPLPKEAGTYDVVSAKKSLTVREDQLAYPSKR
jgi:hypothetical protein